MEGRNALPKKLGDTVNTKLNYGTSYLPLNFIDVNKVPYCALHKMEYFHIAWCQLNCGIIWKPIDSEFKEQELFKCRLYELFESQKKIIFQTRNKKATEVACRFQVLIRWLFIAVIHINKKLFGITPFL